MQVFIRYNNTIIFEFNPTDTIATVKNTYYQKTGIPPNYISLSYNGKFMNNTEPISKYNIDSNSTIYMNLKMPV
jgi:hypothetical protein